MKKIHEEKIIKRFLEVEHEYKQMILLVKNLNLDVAKDAELEKKSFLRNVLINTSVEVKSPIEYGMTLAAYMIAGAEIWPWHKGYKPLDNEECKHNLYGWEECGFLKHAGIVESIKGDFNSPLELINVVKNIRVMDYER